MDLDKKGDVISVSQFVSLISMLSLVALVSWPLVAFVIGLKK